MRHAIPRPCVRGCGFTADPSRIVKHEAVCWTPRTLDRLFEIGRVDTSDPDACWEWNRSRDRWGYGRINGLFPVRVCRAVVELADGAGPLSGSQEPLHSCDHPPCCNPRHLRRGVRLDNVRDMISKGRQGGVQVMGFEERSQLWQKRRQP